MAKSPRGLGRGLDALLGGDQPVAGATTASAPPAALEIDRLTPGRYQPRSHMDEIRLGELAESIRAQGVLQPILVRPIDRDRYEIVAGERRWRAARMAGLASVPVIARPLDDRAAAAAGLIENLQREDLDPIEEAHGLQRLIGELGLTHEQAAQAVGRSRAAVSNALRLLNLAPPVQALLHERRLDMGHARALLVLPAPKQAELAALIVRKDLSVRDAERLVAKAMRPAAKPGKAVDRDLARFEQDLSDRLGTTVRLKTGRKGAGDLVIHYTDLDHLDALVARLQR
jgi:ParB family chromosome partitioning protein